MSDDAAQNSLPYVEQDGIKLGKLSVTDRSKLLRDAKAAALAEKKESIKDAGLPADQAYVELENFKSLIWGANRWIMLAHSQEGQEQILRVALAKENPADKVDDLLSKLILSPDDTLRLVCSLTGLTYRESAPQVPNIKHVGTYDGKPLYIADEATGNPTQAPPTAQTTAARPKAYGEA